MRASRIAGLLAGRRVDSLAYVAQGWELWAVHLDVAALNAELTKQEVRTRQALAQPLARPLLLDDNTHKDGLFGLIGGALLVEHCLRLSFFASL